MKKLYCLGVPVISACLLALSGCGLDQHPSYSAGVKYGVRQDPVITGRAADLGDERYEPDRPGVLPIMHVNQVFDAAHPYHAKLRDHLDAPLSVLIDATGKKSADLPKAEKLTLQNKFMSEPKNREVLDPALDRFLRDPSRLSPEDRAQLDAALEAAFGTPAEPKVAILSLDDFKNDDDLKAIDNGDDEAEERAARAYDDYKSVVEKLKLDSATLKEGSQRYRVHCLHCHGVPGDGRGPTSRWINPHPRDFRLGLFKFQSVDQAKDGRQRPPSRADLLRTLRQGLEGTAMPSFNLLLDKELESIVSYVIHLSIRGRAEVETIKNDFDFDKFGVLVWKAGTFAKSKARAIANSNRTFVLKGWKQANDPEFAIVPVKYPYPELDAAKTEDAKKAATKALVESIQRGKQLFLGDVAHPRGKAAKCVDCHTDFGRQSKFKFDEWGTLARPNNFPAGVFRGGRRPVDMYFRIHSGINGSGMNPFGAANVLTGDDIWDLVNFVSNLAYPGMRKTAGVNID